MRSCNRYIFKKSSCVMSAIFDFYKKYYRFDRYCNLSSLFVEIAKLFRKTDKFDKQILVERTKSLETEVKNLRL